jgi:quercetin dioxygenase-like cupin family protein
MFRNLLALALLGACSSAALLAADSGPLVLYKKDIRLNTTYAWERWGNFINAAPGDGKEIPYDAARLQARVYAFPSGEIRVINFDKGVRTHNHVNMTDTILYTWSGRRVQFVNDQAAVNRPGDAAFHPKGVFHHGEALETGKGVEFAMYVDQVQPEPQATWIPGSSRPFEPGATWMDNGKVVEVLGAAAAASAANSTAGKPADAVAKVAHYEVRTFDFSPHYITRELRIPRGTTLSMLGNKDRLMFMLDGRVSVSSGSSSWEIAQEDAARAPADQLVTLKALEDARILETYVPPKPTPKTAPKPATR